MQCKIHHRHCQNPGAQEVPQLLPVFVMNVPGRFPQYAGVAFNSCIQETMKHYGVIHALKNSMSHLMRKRSIRLKRTAPKEESVGAVTESTLNAQNANNNTSQIKMSQKMRPAQAKKTPTQAVQRKKIVSRKRKEERDDENQTAKKKKTAKTKAVMITPSVPTTNGEESK